MRLGLFLAAPVLAVAFATSALAASTQTVTIVFTPKTGKACTMTLTNPPDGTLAGKGCGTAFDVGVATSASAAAIATATGKEAEGFFVDLTNNTYTEYTTKTGKTVTQITGKVKVTIK